MRSAIRDRSQPVIEREDAFLEAGDRLNAAFQQIRAADLGKALDAGAEQVAASVAKLSDGSVFSHRQVEAVASIKEGLDGLVQATQTLSRNLRKDDPGDLPVVTSPDYIDAIFAHALRFVPILAAAVGIDRCPACSRR